MLPYLVILMCFIGAMYPAMDDALLSLGDALPAELLALFGGSGGVLYLVLWLIIPEQDAELDAEKEEPSPATETPAQREARRRAERQDEAEKAIAADPLVRALQDAFDATLVADSVRPADPPPTPRSH